MRYLLLLIVLFIAGLNYAQEALPKPVVQEVPDKPWKKVKITKKAIDVEGMQRVFQVKGIALKMEGKSYEEKDEIALRKIKRQAYAKGCRVVLLSTRKEEADRLTILGMAYK